MTDRIQQISYRLAEEADGPAIHRLWTEDTGWGSPAGAIADWYNANPHAGSMAVVAVDGDGEVVGEFIFMAAEAMVDGRVYKALRPIAPIVTKALRFVMPQPPARPPMWGMYGYAAARAQETGVSLFYMLPDPLWARTRMLQRDGVPNHIVFPLWSLKLPIQGEFGWARDCTVERQETWDESVDELWRKTSRLHSCLAVRDARTLRWRSMRPGHSAWAVRSNGELIGIVVSQVHTTQWQLCDVLVADGGEALTATLAAICRLAERRESREGPYQTVAVLVTPFLEAALKQLGFERAAYDFPMLAHPVSPELTREQIAPQKWYVSAND